MIFGMFAPMGWEFAGAALRAVLMIFGVDVVAGHLYFTGV
jgi:hypothetical protein